MLLSLVGVVAIFFLFIALDTAKSDKKNPVSSPPSEADHADHFSINELITNGKASLTEGQRLSIANLENGLSKASTNEQKSTLLRSLADYWKDSTQQPLLYAHYTAEAAKLDNSEKSLTFAAQLMLAVVNMERDTHVKSWATREAIVLFEKAIQINPANDELRVGLGSCYILGADGSGDPQQTMKGIQELLTVVRKDSNNMNAQFMLGVGGIVSGQYDKAIFRLRKVVDKNPSDIQASLRLADAYSGLGNKDSALVWLKHTKSVTKDTAFQRELDKNINTLSGN
ncbi:MAG: tetratricopeptide repeat protein [Ferruginibacter sp.]